MSCATVPNCAVRVKYYLNRHYSLIRKKGTSDNAQSDTQTVDVCNIYGSETDLNVCSLANYIAVYEES